MSESTLITITAAGAVPTAPATVNENLYALALTYSPGLTVLPPNLIADLGGTGTAALAICEQAGVETVNSVTPYGANPFLVAELGAQFGVPPGQVGVMSVVVVFTGTPGFPIYPGFLISDGAYQVPRSRAAARSAPAARRQTLSQSRR